jgi:hypothetical protein
MRTGDHLNAIVGGVTVSGATKSTPWRHGQLDIT